MEPITLILKVLVAGAVTSSHDMADQAIKDAYQGLRKLIQQKLGDKTDSELVLTKFDEQPEVWQVPLKDMLVRVHVDQDEEIIRAAQRLLALVDLQQSTMDKYNVHIAGNAQAHRFVIGERNTVIFQQVDAIFSTLDETVAHTKYLEKLYNRYSTVTLPIGPADGFSLQAVFQPLKLRRDPLAAEDLAREERRALLGEPTRSDYDPRYARLISNDQWTDNIEQQEDLVTIANDGNEALIKSPYERMVVLGAPGTGKTTLLRYLIGQRAQQALNDYSASIPIFISLPDLARSGRTLREYLIYTVQEMMINERYADVLWNAIVEGRAFICLDSLDEVAPKQRPEKIRLINELAAESGNVWVVGSRFTDYKGGQLGRGLFTEWELQSMNRTLRSELAQRLIPELHKLMPKFSKLATREPTAFVNSLEKHPRAAAWGNNPLLFSIGAVVFIRTGMLPSSRTELYKEVIKAVFESREVGIQPEMLRLVMADLALELYKEKGRTFTRSDLLRLLPYVRKRQSENWDTEEMFNRIVNSGVLEVVAEVSRPMH